MQEQKNMDVIKTPTIILNEEQAKKNLHRMAQKAAAKHIRFRPHFKTHQSEEIGNWFREEGIREITVSSVGMAEYFAAQGWQDILIAFPVNIREIESICSLSDHIHLGILVDMEESIRILGASIKHDVDVWIKIDTGLKRAGIWWKDTDEIIGLMNLISRYSFLKFRGLLTHAGQTYHTNSRNEVLEYYQDSNYCMNQLRDQLVERGYQNIELSVGDTPGCWLSEDLGNVDEIRPGNFIFFDAMMFQLGVCRPDEIAVCVACPIVSIYPKRQEIVIYGGAVHLSKELIENINPSVYGYAVFSPDSTTWEINPLNYVRSLSQEHGVVCLRSDDISRVKIGDLIYIVPVHSCLVVEALKNYITLTGKTIRTRIS